MKAVIILIGILVLVAACLITRQFIVIQKAIQKLSYDNKPFVRINKEASQHFLFVGDSTALGTGALDNRESVAGWFGQDFQEASIENISANGKKLYQLDAEFDVQGKRYDLIVIQIGGNDIMKLTPISESETHIRNLVRKARKATSSLVIMHSGNVGLAPVFTWPFNWILTERARQMRALYRRVAKEEGAYYIDLFTERSNDLFLKDIDRYYSPDHLHPSGQGYRWWYDRIRTTLKEAGVSLTTS